MEKESVSTSVGFVRCNKIKKYQVYDLVKYNGYTWIVIEADLLFVRLMMKNCLPEEKMKKIFDDDYFFNFDDQDDLYTAIDMCTYTNSGVDYNYFSYNDIKYSLDKTCNDWNKTEIKRGLNNEFLKEFNKNELVKMKTIYDENRYSFDYIRIPIVGEIERLAPDKVRPDRCCWTMSSNDVGIWVETVRDIMNPSLSWSKSRQSVRPVITLKSDNQKIEKIGTV